MKLTLAKTVLKNTVAQALVLIKKWEIPFFAFGFALPNASLRFLFYDPVALTLS